VVTNVKPSDEELMCRVQKGDMNAFELLYDRFHSRLFHYILRFIGERTLAEDILQETFLRLLKGREGYRKNFGFSTYLFTIARNLCFDNFKSWQKSHLQFGREDRVDRAGNSSSAAHKLLEEAEMARILQNEIQTLPEDQREVLLLSKYSGLSYNEIAKITGSTPSAAKQKAYRAMVSLKEKLKIYAD